MNDMPTRRHKPAYPLSFADGHVERWRWIVPKVFTSWLQPVLPAEMPDACVFHAGTLAGDGAPVTAGGRVLCVTALADSVKQAQQRAYEVLRGIHFDGAQYRRDIGHRAIKR